MSQKQKDKRVEPDRDALSPHTSSLLPWRLCLLAPKEGTDVLSIEIYFSLILVRSLKNELVINYILAVII